MTDLRVFENNQPTLTVHIKRKLPDGTTEPFLLDTATEVAFFVKAARADDDADALMTLKYTLGHITIIEDGTTPGVQASSIAIQVPVHSVMATPATHPCHLDVTKNTHVSTVLDGRFIIENT